MLKTVLVAQIGARMHYAVPRLLHRAGRLEHLYTDFSAAQGWPRLFRLLPKPLRTASVRRLLGRVPQDVPASHITAFTSFGLAYARRLRQASGSSDRTAAFLWAGETFAKKVAAGGLGQAAAVYAFNSAALELFQHARVRGRRTVLEQTIAPKAIEHAWLEGERRAFPDWEPEPEEDRFRDAFIAREAAEWAAADLIVCGSEFVRDGIARCGGPVDRCRVVPYGVEPLFRAGPRPAHGGPLRVLTVGEVGLRKGSPHVLAAAEGLRGRAVFRMVGPVKASPAAAARLRAGVELTGSVPRSEMAGHFQWADVFLLPSLCEGSATAAYEALACGLPVIATPNAGTVVRDGIDGFLVPPRGAGSIVEALEKLIGHGDRLREMSHAARERAAQFDLPAYQENLLSVLRLDSGASSQRRETFLFE